MLRCASLRRPQKSEEKPSPVNCKGIFALSTILDRMSKCDGDLTAQSDWFENEIPHKSFVPFSRVPTLAYDKIDSSCRVVFGCSSSSCSEGFSIVKCAKGALRELELAAILVKQLHTFLGAQYQAAKEGVLYYFDQKFTILGKFDTFRCPMDLDL